ncbi:hypothetical protein GCM10011348_18490 [Marinobacterium nitratireducens]|uniref:DUF599 domain-containing protein n=1 Tax=Marinobacterium nitratireducens TaxID=518897 RepID=A0A917ZCP3_9GAMM|nr:DUF599 family protein [Marinobacterium nitratireducens]GGO80853.1 hypothetical protein GCM10011348_18490 [Marinobacterium nitratireducens]
MVQGFVMDHWPHLVAMVWFVVCFRGYMYYSRVKSKTTACLASVMHLYRLEWMRHMLMRENRIPDTSAIANLERTVAFFASTTMLILAGLMTLLSAKDKAISIVSEIPFAYPTGAGEWEFKLLLLLVLFVYAFFKFTWSLRQYGFVSVMVGGAPLPGEAFSDQRLEAHAARIAKMTSLAANNFNIGLRTYYFCLAVLGWFIHPGLFMLASTTVVYVLYRREFSSSTLNSLMLSAEADDAH